MIIIWWEWELTRCNSSVLPWKFIWNAVLNKYTPDLFRADYIVKYGQ